MRYRDAVIEAFVSCATSWGRLPVYWHGIRDGLIDGACAIYTAVMLFCGPLLALLSPLLAFAVLKNEQDEERARAYAERMIDEQYGAMRQRAGS